MDFLKSMKNLVLEEVEVEDPKHNVQVIPNISVPPATNMFAGTSLSINSTPIVDQEAIKVMDEKSKAKFQTAINSKNPKFYVKLNDLLATLAEDMPNEGAAYKTAIKLLAKEGASTSLLISDLDICISAIDENNKSFSDTVAKKLNDLIGSRQSNITNIDQTIAQQQQQIQALQANIATLSQQKTNESSAINEETQKINLSKERFSIVYNQLRSQLLKQKDNILNYSK